jgi:hypothetical protein
LRCGDRNARPTPLRKWSLDRIEGEADLTLQEIRIVQSCGYRRAAGRGDVLRSATRERFAFRNDPRRRAGSS